MSFHTVDHLQPSLVPHVTFPLWQPLCNCGCPARVHLAPEFSLWLWTGVRSPSTGDVGINNFCDKISRCFRSTWVKVPPFTVDLLVIRYKVNRAAPCRAACDDYSSDLANADDVAVAVTR